MLYLNQKKDEVLPVKEEIEPIQMLYLNKAGNNTALFFILLNLYRCCI
ncbi:MAG: Unknown protein [uncultured Sulfurovum sp.]|uniref:Uncharacterized protein n=1 Tax=uncultured Sulfurovum sp. TaxID=269237 RepID=A0A6S6TDX0_9BACT|nr:MAG: Unknown protein [uncultured Sulfurovum sp.]